MPLACASTTPTSGWTLRMDLLIVTMRHKWRMELRRFPGDKNIQTFYKNFGLVWIPYAYGSVRFIYGDVEMDWPEKDFSDWGARGFNGQDYPILNN